MKIKGLLISVIIALGVGNVSAQSPEPWWFDIEVIVFKRNLDTPPVEQFENVEEVPKGYTYDLTTSTLKPNVSGVLRALSRCEANKREEITTEQIIEDYQSWQQLIAEQEAEALDSVTIAPVSEQVLAESLDTLAALTSEITDQDSDLNEAGINDFTVPEDDIEGTVEDFAEDIEESPMAILIKRRQVLLENTDDLEPLITSRNYNCLSESDIVQTDHDFYFVNPQLPELTQIPKRIDGYNWFLPQLPHILPVEELQLIEFADQIERLRRHDVMHHTVWRQEVVFGRDIAPSVRLVAGENFTSSYLDAKSAQQAQQALLGEQETIDSNLPESIEDAMLEDTFFVDLRQALASKEKNVDVKALLDSTKEQQPDDPNEMQAEWELDGEFKVYLQYINGVPYLHIDSELVFQVPEILAGEEVKLNLQKIPFKQLRRVISKQIHYFDHPLFGLVIQIRRHQRPSLPDVINDTTTTNQASAVQASD